jgi:hypothetical protein
MGEPLNIPAGSRSRLDIRANLAKDLAHAAQFVAHVNEDAYEADFPDVEALVDFRILLGDIRIKLTEAQIVLHELVFRGAGADTVEKPR